MKRSRIIRKTPLAKMSAKRKAGYGVYAIRRKLFLERHPFCEFPLCFNRSMDWSHELN